MEDAGVVGPVGLQCRDQAFSGVKLALFCGPHILTYQRDDNPGLLFAGHWDLPGGGREANESPLECIQRELHEECRLDVTASRIVWARCYTRGGHPPVRQYFLVAEIGAALAGTAVFGEEGRCWTWMSPANFIAHPNAVRPLQNRLAHYMARETTRPAPL